MRPAHALAATRRLPLGYVISVAIGLALAAVSILAKLLIFERLGVNAGFVVYIPAVAVAAWLRGMPAGLTATVATAAGDALALPPPPGTAPVDIYAGQVRLAGYILAGAVISFMSHGLRSARQRAELEAEQRQQVLEAEAAARRRLDELVVVQHDAAVLREAFSGIVSHELRTPITAIYGGAKLLASGRDLDDETRRDLVRDIESESERLYRLVEDLLVLTRAERGAIELGSEPILITRVAERVLRAEQARWPAAGFAFKVDGAVGAASGDETYVEQVLRNLLGNAAKYSPAGTHIEMVIDETDEGIRTRVMDAGPGIDGDEASRLFELFYRSEEARTSAAGAGIGLFVCRALVQAMGGRVWAQPRPEGGSEFGFLLPPYVEDATDQLDLRTAAKGSPDAADRAAADVLRAAGGGLAPSPPTPPSD